MLSDQPNESPESPQAATSSTTQQSVIVPRSGLPPFPRFDPLSNPTNTRLRWRKWLRRFENLLISLRETDPTVKRGLLLSLLLSHGKSFAMETDHRPLEYIFKPKSAGKMVT
jgi:hypothetical protein